MSWTVVIGLTVIAAVALPSLYLVREVLTNRRRDKLDAQIKEVDDALCKAIENEPCNLAEHQRLSAELERLRKLRDAL